MLCSHRCYTAQAPRLPGELKKENKPKTGKRNLPKLNCDPPPEGNAFLEKANGKVLKAVSVKTKVFDRMHELLRLKANCYRNNPLQHVLNDSSADFSCQTIPAAHTSSGIPHLYCIELILERTHVLARSRH